MIEGQTESDAETAGRMFQNLEDIEAAAARLLPDRPRRTLHPSLGWENALLPAHDQFRNHAVLGMAGADRSLHLEAAAGWCTAIAVASLIDTSPSAGLRGVGIAREIGKIVGGPALPWLADIGVKSAPPSIVALLAAHPFDLSIEGAPGRHRACIRYGVRSIELPPSMETDAFASAASKAAAGHPLFGLTYAFMAGPTVRFRGEADRGRLTLRVMPTGPAWIGSAPTGADARRDP